MRSGLDGKRSPIFATPKRMIAIGANPSYSTMSNEQFTILAHASFLQKEDSGLQEKHIFECSANTMSLWPEKQAGSRPGSELPPSQSEEFQSVTAASPKGPKSHPSHRSDLSRCRIFKPKSAILRIPTSRAPIRSANVHILIRIWAFMFF